MSWQDYLRIYEGVGVVVWAAGMAIAASKQIPTGRGLVTSTVVALLWPLMMPYALGAAMWNDFLGEAS